MIEYTVLGSKNDWLKNYRGNTYTDKLRDEITKGVFEESSKYKSGNKIFTEQMVKKCLITCINPKTNELESVGASSLLKNEITGKIFDNLILDNFGKWFAAIITNSAFVGGGLTEDTGGSQTVSVYAGSQTSFNIKPTGLSPTAGKVRMGSGVTAPARSDFKIQTALISAPESGYLVTNAGAWTVSNTVIYQADANPTGGTGTVNEAGSFEGWWYTVGSEAVFMLTHDAISPGVPFTAGKLLRASYIWSL